MASKTNTAVLEVDAPENRKLLFRPASRVLRGRFDPLRLTNPGELLNDFRGGIPGVRLVLDFGTNQARIEDPLLDPENTAIRAKAEKYNLRPENRAVFELDQDGLATWLHFARLGLEGGQFKLVSGELPEKLPGKVKMDFVTKQQDDPADKLAAALERVGDLLEKLLERRQ
jgi:hypothetical protein